MVIEIPTWLVTIDGEKSYRVPEPNLEGFLHVLVFNGTTKFAVERQPTTAELFAESYGPEASDAR